MSRIRMRRLSSILVCQEVFLLKYLIQYLCICKMITASLVNICHHSYKISFSCNENFQDRLAKSFFFFPPIIKNGCCICVKCFFCIYWDDRVPTLAFFSFGGSYFNSRTVGGQKFINMSYTNGKEKLMLLWEFSLLKRSITGETTKAFFTQVVAL